MPTAPVKDPDSNLTTLLYTWTLGVNETGDWVDMSQYPDRVIQVVGTYGGATVTFQGSHDQSNGALLTDYDGNSLSYTSGNNVVGIRENTKYCRPVITGGSGTSITIMLLGNGVRQ